MLNGEFNEDALAAMYEELADSLQLVDNGLRRQELFGKPVDEIKPQAVTALATVGVKLPDEQLAAYASALSSGEKYVFDLSRSGSTKSGQRPESSTRMSRWFKRRP